MFFPPIILWYVECRFCYKERDHKYRNIAINIAIFKKLCYIHKPLEIFQSTSALCPSMLWSVSNVELSSCCCWIHVVYRAILANAVKVLTPQRWPLPVFGPNVTIPRRNILPFRSMYSPLPPLPAQTLVPETRRILKCLSYHWTAVIQSTQDYGV